MLELDRQEAAEAMAKLSDDEKALLASGKQYYEITFRNIGGLVMPLILEFEYEDGEREVRRIPAEIWKMSEPTVTKVFVTDRPATRITLDPYLETADVDMGNNVWPPRPEPTRFEVFQGSGYSRYRSGGESHAARPPRCRASSACRRRIRRPAQPKSIISPMAAVARATPHRADVLGRSPSKTMPAAVAMTMTLKFSKGMTIARSMS